MLSTFTRNELSTAQIRVLLSRGYQTRLSPGFRHLLEKETTDAEEDDIIYSQTFGEDGSKHLDWFLIETKSGMLHRLPAESAQDAVFRHNLYYIGADKAAYVGAAPKLTILETSVKKMRLFSKLREKAVITLKEIAPVFFWDREKIKVEEENNGKNRV